MVTTERDSDMPSGGASSSSAVFCDSSPNSHNVDVNLQNENSWAERSEEFLNKLKECNAFSEDDNQRFFIIKRQDGDFAKTSPFLIQKGIQSVAGDVKTIRKLRSGELLIEVYNSQQAKNIKKCTQLANIPVTITAHRTLNSCRGVISEIDLLYVSESELLENLKDQRVTNVKRISIYKNSVQIPTKHIVLTFACTKLPETIKAGYLNCKIRPYFPNPLRCFKCQRFGHSQTSCRGKLICGRCSAEGHESHSCNETYRCVNCNKDHPSYSKSCEKWKLEKEIQIVRTKQNLPYIEAKRVVLSRTPIAGLSYAAVSASTSQKKTYRSIETQTEIPTTGASILKSPTTAPTKSSVAQNQNKKSVSSTSKLTSQKKPKDTCSTTKPTNQNNKPTNKKNLPPLKSCSTNLSTKKKKLSPPKGLDKNSKTLSKDNDALSLHPTDSSDNDDNVSDSDDMEIVL